MRYLAPEVDIIAYARAYIDSDAGADDRRRSLFYAQQAAPQRRAEEKAQRERAEQRAAQSMGMAL
jgi:hypothetical protein